MNSSKQFYCVDKLTLNADMNMASMITRGEISNSLQRNLNASPKWLTVCKSARDIRRAL